MNDLYKAKERSVYFTLTKILNIYKNVFGYFAQDECIPLRLPNLMIYKIYKTYMKFLGIILKENLNWNIYSKTNNLQAWTKRMALTTNFTGK